MTGDTALENLEDVVERLVASGRYGSRGEVIREGVRLVDERERKLAALDAALARGIADAEAGRVYPAEEVFAELKARYQTTPERLDNGE